MKNVNKQLYDAYQKGGASAVYDLANKLGLPYHPCKQCEADTSTIKHVTTVCGVCGTIKRDIEMPISTMYFKDEGDYWTYKLKNGKPVDPNSMYEFGSLETCIAPTKARAKFLAKSFGLTPVFG